MGFLMESAEVGNIGLKQLAEQKQIVTQKWDSVGLLEGLQGVTKENIAQLMENQLSHMLNESSDSYSSGQFETVAFPVIRRIFAKLLANDLVSVQALNLPIGKLYYINPKTSVRTTGQGGGWQYDGRTHTGTSTATVTGLSIHNSPDGAYSNAATTLPANRQQFETRSLYDGFYADEYYNEGTSLFDNSKGDYQLVTGAATLVTPSAWADGLQKVTIKVGPFTQDMQGRLVGPVGVPADTESFMTSLKITCNTDLEADAAYAEQTLAAGAQLQYHTKVQKWGSALVEKDGYVYLNVDLTYPGLDGFQPFTVATGVTPVFNYEYRVYADLEEDSRMAEVTFKMDSVTVSVEPRKMRAQWTPELAQDVSAFHNIDAEAELTALLSEQMGAEIDREILRDLRRESAWFVRWDYNAPRNQTATYYGTQKDYNQTLVTKINQIAAQIAKATLRGTASWIVVSPEVSAVLDDLEYFHVSNAAPDQDKYNMGIERIGSLQGRYQVYRDPYAPADTILVGHRGSRILEAGYIYAPYVPMQLTPVMYNPFDFTPIRGVLTRYAKKMVLNRYYGRISCSGLQTFGIGELM